MTSKIKCDLLLGKLVKNSACQDIFACLKEGKSVDTCTSSNLDACIAGVNMEELKSCLDCSKCKSSSTTDTCLGCKLMSKEGS